MRALCLLLLLLFAAPALAHPGPLVVILLPGTSLRDWQAADASNLHRLMVSGALAVMNTRTARLPGDKIRETPESAMLTLGAGSRAAGLPDTSAAHDQWAAYRRENTGRGYDIHLGNFSDALAAGGVSVSAGGARFAGLVAASGAGKVNLLSSLNHIPEGCTIWDGGSIQTADAVIAQAAAQVLARQGRLIILSPFVSDTDYAAGRRLTPVLEFGNDVPIGLLDSASTRRLGLVTNTDFAPSVAAYFGIARSSFPVVPFGYAWNAVPAAHAENQVSKLEASVYRQSRGMKVLPYIALALAVWMLAGTALAYCGKLPACLVWGPLAALLAVLMAATPVEAAVQFFAFTMIGVLLSLRYTTIFFILTLPALTVFILAVDMATGSHLMQQSLLGYSAVEGARYYGIGNEAMGLLIGAALVAAARIWPEDRPMRQVIIVCFAVIVLLLGLPQAGAKAGGLLVAVAAFGTFVWESVGGKWSWRVAVAFAAATAGVMGAFAIGDAVLLPAHHSHMGEAVRRIAGGGFAEAWDIVTRKLAVESRLAWHSAWACLLWVGLACLLWLERISGSRNPALKTAGLVAVAACVLLNDAGVIAAALCLVPLWCEGALRAAANSPGNTTLPGL